ncbi:GNAT family N-acetyltransferase [Agrococcus sp. SGAir0287]|uniref:GNAT family N-acetyltransferase n=1 Tax=Agrococcus sp. SGAir0287 TaxID=2070347 RepID=UPI0010CD07F8|nr:GNAT family protein [Agrococcus sp. SGAir0287]QCR20359.1 N-acetyltransferase [Agrococcus sp. SGAir0287]
MRAWPLLDLVLRTPRLELRPVRDVDLDDLVDAALSGIHEPHVRPFLHRWDVGSPDEVRRNLVQYHWRTRAAIAPDAWALELGVHLDGRVVGVQAIEAKDLAVTRKVESGSWIRQDVQGRGIGTEMRQAVLLFAFDVLGADVALSGYLEGNEASAAVSRKVGYVENGRGVVAVDGERYEDRRVRLDRDAFVRPDWRLQVEGWEAARRDLLGD